MEEVSMLGDSNIYPMLGVKDLAAAKQFYVDKLGLQADRENPYEVRFKSGSTLFSIYATDLAGTNKATAATWEIEDMNSMIKALKDKGITFEHYDMGGITREDDVHIMGNEKAAWFKDPDGNILCLHTEE
jgi:catechol 2,3-dioxygenase-like lactoylglutathione lyase family enzyme